MKTSNKILLATLILIMLVMAGTHFGLMSKFKKGGYTTTIDRGPGKDTIAIKPIRFVKIKNLDNVILVPAYAYRLEVEKNMPSYFKYSVSGDTLFVSGDTTGVASHNIDDRRKIYQEVSLHLPQMKLIEVENSSLGVTGKNDSTQVGIIRLSLIESRLSFNNHFHLNDSAEYLGDVFITAKKHSEIEFSATTLNFKTLACRLDNSVFRDNEMGNIQKFMVTADDSSKVQMSGKNYKKLTVVPWQD
ncbi:MAG TPA: hypothetical protein VK625_22930 [Flavitalea sp.]|nr:hypothetical protein [Flavitalea sp.]